LRESSGTAKNEVNFFFGDSFFGDYFFFGDSTFLLEKLFD